MSDGALAHNEEQAGTGILLVQLGSPEAPTPRAVRAFLREFLWDPRVVDMARPLWWLLLHGVILRTRPRRSAELYEKIWLDEGSPLMVTSRRQATLLAAELRRRMDGDAPAVVLAMRYGKPSIREGLEALRRRGCERLLVLPLYPQYSSSTTGSVFDAVAEVLRGWRVVPSLRMISHYYEDDGYHGALVSSVREAWETRSQPERLLISFHGQPWRHARAGDPYHVQCRATAARLAAALRLPPDRWALSYQSRFGREPWLEPYTVDVLSGWGGCGVKSVSVICPGFAADCLETLEEINLAARDIFMRAGGERFHYIPALNERPDHIAALAGFAQRQMLGWERDDC
jgi:ferrochelatase